MKGLFSGGIHPADRKELSTGSTPVPAPIPTHVTIPMLQHIGVPCEPLVQVGDTVKMGQKVGDGPGLCVPVHASVSGKVLAVEPRLHLNGKQVMSVVIENDFQDTPDQKLEPHRDSRTLSSQEILSIIREAGIVGMGGATFSTNAKAESGLGKVDTIIANACECEPYITSDDMLLQTYPEQVLGGMKIMCQVLQPKRVVLAVEDNKKTAISILREKMAKERELELKVLPTRFPQGAEKQLVKAVTGREIPPGGLPSSVGCIVFNAATFAAIYKAVILGQPVTRRIVTVTGEAVKNPQNYIVRIGTSFADLVEAAGGLTEDADKILSGGPMMGVAQGELDVPLFKGTNCVLCLRKAQNCPPGDTCIRCAKCVRACPMHLQPLYLYRYEKAGELAALQQFHLMDCIECGCCSYVCPAKLPLVERFRAGKQAVKEASSK